MQTPLLDKIKSPDDIKCLDNRQLEQLCHEVRIFLIDNVSKTGGHLSSNLGVVELTVAMHRCFSTPYDSLVFDVGHQCYTHKLLTGRRSGFDNLRKENGMSGFPSPAESPHDSFKAGHGSTSISAAIGMARAKKIKKEPGVVIAVIGDGAFTGGMVYEGLNNVSGLDNLIVVLNDNKMSISKNVGSLAHYFNNLRTSPNYYKAKSDVKNVLGSTPVIGDSIMNGIRKVKSSVRRSIYHSTFFEEMGFQYMGPIDGHNVIELCSIFSNLRNTGKPYFIYLETKKGKGFDPAERNPGAYHGVSSFNIKPVADPDNSPKDSYSTVFGKELTIIANDDPDVCAITAAMKYGTGLQYFKKNHPERFFDVGMAEEHAVTFAAGLATKGLKPVVAIYSTFLQRAYDQIIHDVMLQNLNVMFAIDRAGIVPGDGETHQGIYDAAFLSQQQNLKVVSPSNYAELKYWMAKLLAEETGPKAVRYPRGTETELLAQKSCCTSSFKKIKNSKSDIAIVSYGSLLEETLKTSEKLNKKNIKIDVWQIMQINPIEEKLVLQLMDYKTVFFPEETVAKGSIGEHLGFLMLEKGYKGRFIHRGVPNTGIDHAEVYQIRKHLGLDFESMAQLIKEVSED